MKALKNLHKRRQWKIWVSENKKDTLQRAREINDKNN